MLRAEVFRSMVSNVRWYLSGVSMPMRRVEDILDVSRIASGKMRLNMQPVELPIVLNESGRDGHARWAVRDIPAAALTAYARSEDRAKALQSGFELHLAKPIDPAELISAVQALARRRVRTDSK
jgi:CheY-like chemotaxis protein